MPSVKELFQQRIGAQTEQDEENKPKSVAELFANRGASTSTGLKTDEQIEADKAYEALTFDQASLGALETIGTIGSSAAAEVSAGLAGLFEFIASGGDENAAANTVNKVRQNMTYLPKTKQGKDNLDAVADIAESVGQIINFAPSMLYSGLTSLGDEDIQETLSRAREFRANPSAALGNDVYEATGIPELAALAETAPAMAEIIFGGFTAKQGVKSIGSAQDAMSGRKAKRQQNQIARFLQNVNEGQQNQQFLKAPQVTAQDKLSLPSPNGSKAGTGEIRALSGDQIQQRLYKREADYAKVAEEMFNQGARLSGKNGKDAKFARAVNQGFREDIIAEFSNMTNGTKSAVREMVDLGKQLINATGTFKDNNRLAAVAGKSLKKRYDDLADVNKAKRKELDNIVRNQLANQKINVNDVISRFEDDLFDLGLTIERNADGSVAMSNNGNVKINIEPNRPLADVSARKDVRTIRAYLNRMAQGSGEIDAKAVHQLKKDIQNEVDFNNPNKVGVQADRVLKGLQRRLNDKLRNQNANYAKVNDDLSEIIAVRENVDRLFKTVSKDEVRTPNQIGLALRKIRTNYGTGEDMKAALMDIDNVARKNGIKFDDNIAQQVQIAYELEDKLGLTPKGTQKGIVDDAAQNAVNNVVQAAAEPTMAGANYFAKVYDNLVKGRDPEKALKSIEDLLNE